MIYKIQQRLWSIYEIILMKRILERTNNSTNHYIEKLKIKQHEPHYKPGKTQVLLIGKQFLLHQWHRRVPHANPVIRLIRLHKVPDDGMNSYKTTLFSLIVSLLNLAKYSVQFLYLMQGALALYFFVKHKRKLRQKKYLLYDFAVL